jgi:hypothetical protein
VHGGQRGRRHHLAKHLHRVVLDDAHVAQLLLAHQLEQRTDARRVHLQAEQVVLRVLRGVGGAGVAHAEADLQHAWGLAAEGRREVERLPGGVGQQETRAQLGHGALLARAHAAGAQHEAADRALQRVRARVGFGWRCGRRGFGSHGVGRKRSRIVPAAGRRAAARR